VEGHGASTAATLLEVSPAEAVVAALAAILVEGLVAAAEAAD
jgi:hypothetical protein